MTRFCAGFVRLMIFTCFSLLVGACTNIGAPCRDNGECGGDTRCCSEDRCDRGMCTFRCDNDRDCPGDMACNADHCFYLCQTDRDCQPGFDCQNRDGTRMCQAS